MVVLAWSSENVERKIKKIGGRKVNILPTARGRVLLFIFELYVNWMLTHHVCEKTK